MRHLRPFIMFLGLAMSGSGGCARWREASVPPEEVFEGRAEKLMLVLADSTTLILHRPVIHDGIVRGVRESIRGRVSPGDTVAVPISAVARTRTWYAGWVPLGPLALLLGVVGLGYLLATPST